MVASMVCVFLGIFIYWTILLFFQTLASLRIEIGNYIIQRQRTEERLAANVSFKHQSFLLPLTKPRIAL